jgi:hypothetical protein
MKYFVATIVGYAVGWTLAYASIMGDDFHYYFTYLRLAWTGGFERPVFCQIGALAGAVVVPFFVWVWRPRRTPQ